MKWDESANSLVSIFVFFAGQASAPVVLKIGARGKNFGIAAEVKGGRAEADPTSARKI
jgi:hypothetical protein